MILGGTVRWRDCIEIISEGRRETTARMRLEREGTLRLLVVALLQSAMNDVP